MNTQSLITIREKDNRHPADLERMRAERTSEVDALRAEVRRLRAVNDHLSFALALYLPVDQMVTR